ncbi:hypothetical protein Osc7112_0469 [Oscillatoria nigro-viridis PCC 7112]|uniref:Uncharacterized protein n=1 Tax=Phormidium nigroviride PCC 7112 TaxID=179408 RepID=K9VB67_9CYAN|nr:hypothetical protein Osc7112_0469 [Oscillatoria nigro-viridis PCC 7112]
MRCSRVKFYAQYQIVAFLTTLGPRRAEILVSFSPLNKYSFLYLPEMVLSSSFRLIAESCSRVPHGTIQNPKYWFLWYLLLEVFTRASFSAPKPITSVFKVRCLQATGFLMWLNTLATLQYYHDQE